MEKEIQGDKKPVSRFYDRLVISTEVEAKLKNI